MDIKEKILLKYNKLYILNKKNERISRMGAIAMFFNRKAQEEKPEDILMDIEVYTCADNDCIGWMRKDFASSDLKCPLCGHDTTMEVRELPKIN
ncbi:cold-inducible protein YdjO-related protein [Robertmurraya korlensis]|uniref:cold-inducible protein YdjO-related protein n=1 Tax=Robertmurraya korlensis TaxID=519977 RepID=UPI000A83C7F3|nr:cold-inducible protein YdjO-related protein [Robertmurraya korlensis]